MTGFSGGVRFDKPPGDELYRPFLELDCKFCRTFAREKFTSPMVLADVGSRGGLDSRWQVFGDHYIEVGFEADAEERDRLMADIAEKGESGRKVIHPFVLWSEEGAREFKIPKGKEAASLLEPNMDFYHRLPDPSYGEIIRRIPVRTTTLDKCTWPHDELDFLKVDVEGADLFVLKGGIELLKSKVVGVVCEVTFVGQFIGQGFFADIDLMLRDLGFAIFDLKPRRWRRKRLGSQFDNFRMGQLVAGDALYLKDPVAKWDQFGGKGREREKLLKLAAIAEFFALPDYGIELVEFGLSRRLYSTEDARAYIEALHTNEIVKYNDFTRHGRTNERIS